MSPKTTKIALDSGEYVDAEVHATLAMRIDGTLFRFAVTANPGMLHSYSVTHIQSGKRVCTVGINGAHLPGNNGRSLKDRARESVNHIVDKCGEARVRSVLAGAPDIPNTQGN